MISLYNLRYKIWLDKNGKVFGEGPFQLLKGIEETGSLTSAARAMNMSYSQAHNLIKSLEKKLGFNLINSKTGGNGGGGSELTEEARLLMERYHKFSMECEQSLQAIFAKYFGNNN